MRADNVDSALSQGRALVEMYMNNNTADKKVCSIDMEMIECPACEATWQGEWETVAGHGVRACAECGLWFAMEGDERADYDELYQSEEYGSDYVEPLAKVTEWRQYQEYITFRPFFKNVPIAGNRRLLDVGCGVGRFCRAAHVAGWQVTGIDLSKTAIDVGGWDVPFSLQCATLGEMVRRGDIFDVVTVFEVLEHLAEPDLLLGEVREALVPGGAVFCTVPNRHSPLVMGSARRDWLPPVHLLFFTEEALHALFARCGFTEIRTGIIRLNAPPRLGRRWVKYWLRRFFRGDNRPDPMGCWIFASKG